MHIPSAPRGIRHAVRRGILMGYRGMTWDEAKAYGHWTRCGWGDGRKMRGLTPYGVRCHIKACT